MASDAAVTAAVRVFGKARVEKLYDTFVLVDLNHNGTLDPEELDIMFHRAGHAVSEEDLRKLIVLADTDEDGELTFGELMEALVKIVSPDTETTIGANNASDCARLAKILGMHPQEKYHKEDEQPHAYEEKVDELEKDPIKDGDVKEEPIPVDAVHGEGVSVLDMSRRWSVGWSALRKKVVKENHLEPAPLTGWELVASLINPKRNTNSVWDAARLGNLERLEACLTALFKAGIDAESMVDNSAFGHKRAPLHHAACNGHVDAVSFLLAHGFPPDTRDAFGRTAIFLAARNGHGEVVELLLSAGDIAGRLDLKDRTAAYFAEQEGHVHIQELLQQHPSMNYCFNSQAEKIGRQDAEMFIQALKSQWGVERDGDEREFNLDALEDEEEEEFAEDDEQKVVHDSWFHEEEEEVEEEVEEYQSLFLFLRAREQDRRVRLLMAIKERAMQRQNMRAEEQTRKEEVKQALEAIITEVEASVTSNLLKPMGINQMKQLLDEQVQSQISERMERCRSRSPRLRKSSVQRENKKIEDVIYDNNIDENGSQNRPLMKIDEEEQLKLGKKTVQAMAKSITKKCFDIVTAKDSNRRNKKQHAATEARISTFLSTSRHVDSPSNTAEDMVKRHGVEGASLLLHWARVLQASAQTQLRNHGILNTIAICKHGESMNRTRESIHQSIRQKSLLRIRENTVRDGIDTAMQSVLKRRARQRATSVITLFLGRLHGAKVIARMVVQRMQLQAVSNVCLRRKVAKYHEAMAAGTAVVAAVVEKKERKKDGANAEDTRNDEVETLMREMVDEIVNRHEGDEKADDDKALVKKEDVVFDGRKENANKAETVAIDENADKQAVGKMANNMDKERLVDNITDKEEIEDVVGE